MIFIRNCLEALRPYHGILLLYEERELLDKLPLDASPTLKKMLSHASPTNSFRTIASDSDLALLHVRIQLFFSHKSDLHQSCTMTKFSNDLRLK